MKKTKRRTFEKVKKFENKYDKQLEIIENKEQKLLSIKSGVNIFDEDLSQKAMNMLI